MAILAAAEFLFCRFRRFREIVSFVSDRQSYKKSLSRAHTYATQNYTMEGAADAHFIVNKGAGNGLFIVGM